MNQTNTTDQTNETILSRGKKYCRECGVELDYNNCSPSRIGKNDYICKMCNNKMRRLWRESNPEKAKTKDTRSNRRRGNLPMSENKSCSAFLGVHIAERLLRHMFKNVTQMPYGNPGYDFVCGNGYLIDIKASCMCTDDDITYRWSFMIKKNVIADYFVLLAFDNRDDLTPMHIWMIPGRDINDSVSISISKNQLHKWDKYVLNIDEVIMCCNALKHCNSEKHHQ